MAEPNALVEFRDPWPPHRVIATARPANLTWGFGPIDQPAKATFSLPSNDPVFTTLGDSFAGMVTIRRQDGYFPWAGWVTDDGDDIESPESTFTCTDHAGALWAKAAEPKDWTEQNRASGDIIRDIFLDADARGAPPLLTRLTNVAGGPTIAYTPQSQNLLSMLQTMATGTNWEWALAYAISGASVEATLIWTKRIGLDRSNEVTFSQGQHFKNVSRARNADGFIAQGVGIGGGGTFSARPAAQLNAQGAANGSIAGRPIALLVPASPVLAGTRVVVEPQITGTEALFAVAQRSFAPPDRVAERLTLHLVESSIDLSKIELGSSYHASYNMRGVSQERDLRCLALNLDLSGVLQMVCEVIRA